MTDMKLHFPATDYGDFIANEPSPLHSTTSTYSWAPLGTL